MRENRKTSLGLRFVLIAAMLVAMTPAVGAEAPDKSAPEGSEVAPVNSAYLWAVSFEQLSQRSPELTSDQLGLILDALQLGTSEFFETPVNTKSWQADVGKPLSALLDRAEGLFSPAQYGDLISGMGELQYWLSATAVIAAPYCTCSTIGGSCVMTGGGPTGTCQRATCTTYEGTDGNYRIGQCGPSAATDPSFQ